MPMGQYSGIPAAALRLCTLEKRRDDKVIGRQRKTNNRANNLQPPWHVDIMYATTVHEFCPRELNDWGKSHQAGQEPTYAT